MDFVHPSMVTIYPFSNGYLQQDGSQGQNAIVVLNWSRGPNNKISVLQTMDLHPIQRLWDVTMGGS